MIVLAVIGTVDVADAASARKSCLDKINEAVTLADKLPGSTGRDAILTKINEARDSRHEGDEVGCVEEIDETLALLHENRKLRHKH